MPDDVSYDEAMTTPTRPATEQYGVATTLDNWQRLLFLAELAVEHDLMHYEQEAEIDADYAVIRSIRSQLGWEPR